MLRHIILIILIFPICLQAQSLSITNGESTKTFDANTYFEMIFYEDGEPCCYSSVSGKIKRILADSLQIRVHDISFDDQKLDLMLKMHKSIGEKDLIMTFPKNQLQMLRGYKSKKSKNGGWTVVGGILLTTGLITLANSYDLSANDFRDGVLISGGLQFGLGIISLSIGSKKKYYKEKGWRF